LSYEVCFPLRYYQKKNGMSDRHSYAQMSRFITGDIIDLFERVTLSPPPAPAGEEPSNTPLAGGNPQENRGDVELIYFPSRAGHATLTTPSSA
jgi:hypothetical protein